MAPHHRARPHGGRTPCGSRARGLATRGGPPGRSSPCCCGGSARGQGGCCACAAAPGACGTRGGRRRPRCVRGRLQMTPPLRWNGADHSSAHLCTGSQEHDPAACMVCRPADRDESTAVCETPVRERRSIVYAWCPAGRPASLIAHTLTRCMARLLKNSCLLLCGLQQEPSVLRMQAIQSSKCRHGPSPSQQTCAYVNDQFDAA